MSLGIIASGTEANLLGNVHGGDIMKLADSTAGAVAYRHSGGPAVTAAMDEMTFLEPVHVGDIIKTYAQVNWAGTSSMEIGVRVEAQPWGNAADEPLHVASAYFVFVAIDEDGRSRRVPPLEHRDADGRTPPARGRDPARAPAGAQGGDRPGPRGMSDWHPRPDRPAAGWIVRVQGDLEDLHRIHADPESWAHFPQGRHVDLARTQQTLDASDVEWAHGLGYWCVRDSVGGPVIGPVIVPGAPSWATTRGGTSTTASTRASVAARTPPRRRAPRWRPPTTSSPTRPVLAYLLAINVASRRTAEKVGLSLVWSGPDAGNDDPDAVRLVYLDREPDDAIRAALDERFTPGPTV